MSEKYFIKDTALKDKQNDKFHHFDFVKNLKKIIEEHNPPFNIALIGKWGVGKSSIINLLKTELNGKEEYKVHEINAWKYENDSLKKAFLKNLWKTLNKEQDVSIFENYKNWFRKILIESKQHEESKGFKDTLKGFLPFVYVLTVIWGISSLFFVILFLLFDSLTTFITTKNFHIDLLKSINFFKDKIWIPLGIPPFFALFMGFLNSAIQNKRTDIQMLRPIETADEYEELFKEEINNYKKKNPNFKKLVVVVDDLDRLSPKKVVDALDAIKAFVDVDECIFIVTCDEEILIQAVEKKRLNKTFDDLDGQLFLDKLFQFKLSLPPIIESDMKDYAQKLAEQEVPDLVRMCNGQFSEIIKVLIHPEVTTPRQVKKLLNIFANNMLIAKGREDGSRKLENELITGIKGIKFLAKLSVLQSDYNDIYTALIKNYNLLEDVVEIYNGDAGSIKKYDELYRFFNKKEEKLVLKNDYQGLINFLIMTQHISVDNISPFIYLGQNAVGLLAGDENQRQIRRNLISGNEKGVINYLEKENADTISLLVLEEIENTYGDDLPFVIKASYQIINFIPDNRKREFANKISIKLQEVSIEALRAWQIDSKNLYSIYNLAESRQGAKNVILYVLKNLFAENESWMSKTGKPLNKEDFINSSLELVNILLNNEKELDNEIQLVIKNFIKNSKEQYSSFPFERIYELYQTNKILFDDYFGLSFYQQLINYISDNKDKGEIIKPFVETLYQIIPSIKKNHYDSLIESLPLILGINKNITANIIPMVDVNSINEESATKILVAIMNIKIEEEDSKLNSIINFLYKIPFTIYEDEEIDLFKEFDNFVYNVLPTKQHSTMPLLIQLVNKLTSIEANYFGKLSKLFNYLKEQCIQVDIYDNFILETNRYFTENQRVALFNHINKGVLYGTFDVNVTDRTYSLYSQLIKNKENHDQIKGSIHQGIDYFSNNVYQNNVDWAYNFLNFLPLTVDIIDKSKLNMFINIARNHMSSYPDLMIKGLRCVGGSISTSDVKECISQVINTANNDTNKIDAHDFLNQVSANISEEDGNLEQYAKFLVENIHVSPTRFLNSIKNNLVTMSDENFMILMKEIFELNNDTITINKSIILVTLEKFFNSTESKKNLLAQIIEEFNLKIVKEFFLDPMDNRIYILEELIKTLPNKSDKLKQQLIRIIGNYKDELNIKYIAELFASAFNTFNDEEINAIYDDILTLYSGYRFFKSKSIVAAQIVPLLRRVNSDNKYKVLEIAKNFGLEIVFKQARQNKQLSEMESETVREVFNLRK
ncbi:putative P-loop ATPase [Priestia megaterium Q3]|uniref:Putative P-loop ATPase n=1 Tax=Priestia megaterium Q3 TaxID=1452722 RepID=A0A806TI19_PRIMG|nr:P-loop NTPase fold protein [Priestia megaterium]AKP77168.1 putative P-loop ATPase [Priestia megaterium Q3]